MSGTKLVIFDLDGTLIDSAADIVHSVNELLQTMGLAALPTDEIEGYIGNGIRRLLERTLEEHATERLTAAHRDYLPIYRRRLLDHTVAYPGVAPALDELAQTGHTLAVLTNKPVRESRMILDGLDLTRHFAAIYGGDSFPRRKPDPAGVDHLLAEVGASARDTWFVGDTQVDYQTARNAAVKCCLVTYGIQPHRIRSLEPDLRVDDLRALARVLSAKTSP